jgi:hypothetical protein
MPLVKVCPAEQLSGSRTNVLFSGNANMLVIKKGINPLTAYSAVPPSQHTHLPEGGLSLPCP